MSNYDAFAKFYDSVMGYKSTEISYIEKLIKQYNPAAKRIFRVGLRHRSILKVFF